MKPDARALFVAAALAFSGAANAQTPVAAPITINSCAPELSSPSPTETIARLPVASSSTGIKIEFVNDSTKTADLVNFGVDSNGRQFVIRDVGKFSPGVSIVHKYRNGQGQAFILPEFVAPNIKCRVDSVHFIDGTSWTKGETQPATPAPSIPGTNLTAMPARVEIDRSTESNLFLVSSTDRVTAFKESDNCSGIASIFVAATGQSTATYSVKPVAAGSCTAEITDEAGRSIAVPILVR